MQACLATQIQSKGTYSSVSQQKSAFPEQSVFRQPIVTSQIKQAVTCSEVLTTTFKDEKNPVQQFADWMKFCKALDLKVPSKFD